MMRTIDVPGPFAGTVLRSGLAGLCLFAQSSMTFAHPAPEALERADALIAQMTPQEKAAQLVLSAVPKSAVEAETKIKNGAGALFHVSDASQLNRLQHIAMKQSRLKIPLLFGTDVLHGFSTIFPVPIAQAASWDRPANC
jgi:beta-glucosidase